MLILKKCISKLDSIAVCMPWGKMGSVFLNHSWLTWQPLSRQWAMQQFGRDTQVTHMPEQIEITVVKHM